MERLHRIMINLPIFTVWYWLFCAVFLIETNFYLENFKLLDTIDTAFVYIMGGHFIFFRKKYTFSSKIYLQCIYLIVILNFLYNYLDEERYYILYYAIIITHIFISLWKRSHLKIKD